MGLKTITREALERAMVADPLFFEGLDLRPKRQAAEEYEEAPEVIEAELEEETMYAEMARKAEAFNQHLRTLKPGEKANYSCSWLVARDLISGEFEVRGDHQEIARAMRDDSDFFERVICEVYPRIAYIEEWTEGDLIWLGLKKHGK